MDNIFVEFLTVGILMAIQALFIARILDTRKPALFIISYAIAAAVTHIIVAILWLESQVLLKIAVVFIVKLLILFIFQRKKSPIVVFIALIVCVIEISTELIILAVISVFYSPQDLARLADTSMRIYFRVVSSPVIIGMFIVNHLIWSKVSSKKSDDGFNTFLVFLVVQSMLLGLSVMVILSVDSTSDFTRLLLVINTALCVVADIYISRTIKKLKHMHVLEMEHVQFNSIVNAQHLYYNNLVSHMQQTNKIRHDFENQLQTVYTLFEKGDKADAHKHLSELTLLVDDSATHSYCANSIIDAIVSEKAISCEENSIRLATDLNVGNELGIDGLSLCSIFTNILDNAIEATLMVDESRREISLSAYEKAGWVVISGTNTAMQYERKKQSERIKWSEHYETFLPKNGLGLSIIEEIAERYDGKVEITSGSGSGNEGKGENTSGSVYGRITNASLNEKNAIENGVVNDCGGFTIRIWLSCSNNATGTSVSFGRKASQC